MDLVVPSVTDDSMAYTLTLLTPRGARGLKRQYKAGFKKAMRAAGEYWTEKILPEHFKAGAEGKYRYEQRSKSHLRRKSREGRGNDPNVYTGRLRDKMLSTKPSVRISNTGMTLIWRGLPRYTYIVDTLEWVANDWRWNDDKVLRGGLDPNQVAKILQWRRDNPATKDGKFRKIKRPNKPAEITTMNRADADALGKTFRAALEKSLHQETPA